jgi:hypothetical protein
MGGSFISFEKYYLMNLRGYIEDFMDHLPLELVLKIDLNSLFSLKLITGLIKT